MNPASSAHQQPIQDDDAATPYQSSSTTSASIESDANTVQEATNQDMTSTTSVSILTRNGRAGASTCASFACPSHFSQLLCPSYNVLVINVLVVFLIDKEPLSTP
jgi:hypothetical protein